MNTTTESRPRLAQHENSVPFFWPFTAAATMIEAGEKLVARNLDFALEAEKIDFGLHPAFASPNRVLLDLHTLRLRDFSVPEASGIPTIVDAPSPGTAPPSPTTTRARAWSRPCSPAACSGCSSPTGRVPHPR